MRGLVLGRAWGYALFNKALRADRARDIIVGDHIRPPSGGRVLDLGCGNGEIADHLGDVEYLGIDRNIDYIDKAKRHSERSASNTYLSADLADLGELEIGSFDVIVAIGVLHHLDSMLAADVVAGAAARLRPGGRLVTIDPVFSPDQRALARVLMALDRGMYVRHPEDYDALVGRSFPTRTVTVRHDLLQVPIPYTHCIIEAQLDRAVEQPTAEVTSRA